MSDMRLKLNDHIVYLQNEILKRDELLEGDSDFEEEEELIDDSYISNSYFSSSSKHAGEGSSLVVTQLKKHKKTSVSLTILEEAKVEIKTLLDAKI